MRNGPFTRAGRIAGLVAWIGLVSFQDVAGQQGESITVWSPASVRFAGLNGAGAALVGHAGTVFTNPAGLATVRHIAVETAYQVSGLDAYTASGAIGWRLGQFDVGFGARHFNLGSTADAALANGIPIGPDTTNQLMGVGSLVYRFPLIAVGVSGRYLRHFQGTALEEATSIDIGMAIAIFDIMALGVAIQNVGGNLRPASTISLPRLTRAGFTMNYVDPRETFRLLSTLEWQWIAGSGSRFVLGGEGGIVVGTVGIVGRAGYASQRLGAAGDTFSYGATLELNLGKIDVGWQPDELTGDPIRRIGFRFAF